MFMVAQTVRDPVQFRTKQQQKKKAKLQRDIWSERGRKMCIDTPRSQQHIKAQLQPRPLLQCVEIN